MSLDLRARVSQTDLSKKQQDISWAMDGLPPGGRSTRNIGEYPRDAEESTLSQILQANAPEKYCLSATACQGILNRARKRGKELPKMLREALEEVIALG